MYNARYEHDSCGVGFVADIKGRRSHRTVLQGLEAVASLTHRGAIAADARSGAGAGLLTQLPHEFLATAYAEAGQPDLDPSRMAVGVLFLNRQNPQTARRVQHLAELICRERGFSVAGWRDVPIDETVLGEAARSTMPDVKHLLLVASDKVDNVITTERQLLLARNELESRMRAESLDGSYVAALSARSIV